MARRITLYCFLSAAFYGGLLCFLSVRSGNTAPAVFQRTELTTCVESPYDAFPGNAFSFEVLLDQEYFLNVFGRVIVPLEIDRHDVKINNVPLSTIALLFPLAILLLLAPGRWLIEKTYNFMAFPVF